jgi:DNA invertase Pin-like site-specific DNA recombinase
VPCQRDLRSIQFFIFIKGGGVPKTRIHKSVLVKLQKTLKTDDAIGQKFGISRQAVHQMRKKYGIPSNLAKNGQRNERIFALYKKGATGMTIAKKFDLSVSQTYRIIENAKVKKPAKKGK